MDSEPTAGDNDQFTAVLLDPLTVALKFAVCPDDSEADDGDSETETVAAGLACSDMAALAVWLELVRLVAITVRLVALLTEAGAV